MKPPENTAARTSMAATTTFSRRAARTRRLMPTAGLCVAPPSARRFLNNRHSQWKGIRTWRPSRYGWPRWTAQSQSIPRSAFWRIPRKAVGNPNGATGSGTPCRSAVAWVSGLRPRLSQTLPAGLSCREASAPHTMCRSCNRKQSPSARATSCFSVCARARTATLTRWSGIRPSPTRSMTQPTAFTPTPPKNTTDTVSTSSTMTHTVTMWFRGNSILWRKGLHWRCRAVWSSPRISKSLSV